MPIIPLLIKLLLPVAFQAVSTKLVDATHHEIAEETVKQVISGSLKSKTMWLGFIIALLGVIQQYQDIFTQFLPQGKTGIFVSVLGAAIMILRSITDSNIIEKNPPEDKN